MFVVERYWTITLHVFAELTRIHLETARQIEVRERAQKIHCDDQAWIFLWVE